MAEAASSPWTIRRPLWRSFPERSLARAVRHVRGGGHAIVWDMEPRRPVARMLLPCDREGFPLELARWAMLSLHRRGWGVLKEGIARGLALVRVPRKFERSAEAWCKRDAQWPGSVREIRLDCTTCAACCHQNRVILSGPDVARWREAGRSELGTRRYARSEAGKRIVRLVGDHEACIHLRDRLCGIYPVRPDMCRQFLPGSESCLAARRIVRGFAE